MKLLIDEVLIFYYYYECSSCDFEDDTLEEFNDRVNNQGAILDRFCIHHTFVNNYTNCTLVIYPQKITLDEVDINTLLYEVLMSFDTKFKITYKPLGGEGCHLSLMLSV